MAGGGEVASAKTRSQPQEQERTEERSEPKDTSSNAEAVEEMSTGSQPSVSTTPTIDMAKADSDTHADIDSNQPLELEERSDVETVSFTAKTCDQIKISGTSSPLDLELPTGELLTISAGQRFFFSVREPGKHNVLNIPLDESFRIEVVPAARDTEMFTHNQVAAADHQQLLARDGTTSAAAPMLREMGAYGEGLDAVSTLTSLRMSETMLNASEQRVNIQNDEHPSNIPSSQDYRATLGDSSLDYSTNRDARMQNLKFTGSDGSFYQSRRVEPEWARPVISGLKPESVIEQTLPDPSNPLDLPGVFDLNSYRSEVGRDDTDYVPTSLRAVACKTPENTAVEDALGTSFVSSYQQSFPENVAGRYVQQAPERPIDDDLRDFDEFDSIEKSVQQFHALAFRYGRRYALDQYSSLKGTGFFEEFFGKFLGFWAKDNVSLLQSADVRDVVVTFAAITGSTQIIESVGGWTTAGLTYDTLWAATHQDEVGDTAQTIRDALSETPTKADFEAVARPLVQAISTYSNTLLFQIDSLMQKVEEGGPEAELAERRVREMVRELILLGDVSLNTLFAGNPDLSNLSGGVIAKTGASALVNLWALLAPLASGVSDPHITPHEYPGHESSNASHANTGNTEQTKSTPRSSPSAAGSGGTARNAKAYIREVIVAAAEEVHHAFYDGFSEQARHHPGFVTIFREELEGSAMRQVLGTIDGQTGFSEMMSTEDYRAGLQLNPDQMTFVDLVRMWFFDLGETSLGSKSDLLEFGDDAVTTQQIRSHASMKEFERLAMERVVGGDRSSFSGRLHYGVPEFFKAIAVRDIVMNVLGSFTVYVDVAEDGGELHFSLQNNLSLASGTRFRRDPTKRGGGAQNKVGIIQSRERGITNNMSSGLTPELDMGGTVRCFWRWTVPVADAWALTQQTESETVESQ